MQLKGATKMGVSHTETSCERLDVDWFAEVFGEVLLGLRHGAYQS